MLVAEGSSHDDSRTTVHYPAIANVVVPVADCYSHDDARPTVPANANGAVVIAVVGTFVSVTA